MKSLSPEAPTVQDHEKTRAKYIKLAWELWQSQYDVKFYVWHPIPERHLEIEVKLFWRGEIAHVHGWTDIVGQITKPITDAFNAILSWFWENVIRPGVEAITGALRGALEWIINGVRWVVDGISGAVAGISSWIQSVGNSIMVVVNSILSQLAQGIAGLGSAISSGLGWLAGELTKATSWIWEQLQGFFSALGEVLKQVGTWIVTGIKTFVVDPLIDLLQPVFDAIRGLIMGIFDFITQGAVAGSPIEWRGSYTRWLGIISGVSLMAVSGLIGAKLIDMIHPIRQTDISDVAKFAMQFSGVAFLQTAFFTTYFDIACSKPVRQELNAIFTPEIPGSGDLIRFMVREVIVPDEFYAAMGLQGFSDYWSKAYFEAHWILPPTERTRTAFLRKQIPEEEYRKFLIWYDFKPDPRPGISLSDVDIMLKTQYDWPGKIDLRWLAEWGEITPTELTELLKCDGMDPTWAPRVASVWLLNQLREELGKVRRVYERRLREGFMNKPDFAAALSGIHYATHVINALLKWADEELDLDEKLELAKEYEKLAKEGVWSVDKFGEELRKIGMVEARITRKQDHIRRLLEIKAAKEAA